MAEPASRGRENTFLIAAIALPVIVVTLFLVAAAVPRWTVPPPGYDLVLRSDGGYTPADQHLVTTIRVRDGRVVAEFQAAVPNSYPQRPLLYVFNHLTNTAVEVPFEVPTSLQEGEKTRVEPVPR